LQNDHLNVVEDKRNYFRSAVGTRPPVLGPWEDAAKAELVATERACHRGSVTVAHAHRAILVSHGYRTATGREQGLAIVAREVSWGTNLWGLLGTAGWWP
jgi:hypothetical protein